MESNNIDTEETPKSALFTLKNAALALGILAALGFVTAGSLRLLRGGSKFPITSEQGDDSEENDINNQVQSKNLIFDEISSSTTYWIPFFVGNSPYGIIPKQADNTCTLLNDTGFQVFTPGSGPKLSKDGRFVYYFDFTLKEINRFDLDTKKYLIIGVIKHVDNHFAITSDKLIKGARDYVFISSGYIYKIRRYELNSIGTETLSHEDFKTNCELYEPRVLATTSDGTKVFYACLSKSENSISHKNYIYLKDFSAGPDAEDSLVCEISVTPDWFLISPDDQYIVHFVTESNTVEIRKIQDGSVIANGELGADVDFQRIENIAFSEDRESVHIINVHDSYHKQGATIRTIDFKKLLNGKDDFLGEPLSIEFPPSKF